MEGGFDGRNRAFNLHVHGIAGSANDGEVALLGETNHRVIVLLSWTKAVSKLRHGEKMPVMGAGRVVKILEERIQAGLVAQGQNDIELQDLGFG